MSVEPKVYTKERESRVGLRNEGEEIEHTKPGYFYNWERLQFQRRGILSSVRHHFQENFPCILGTKK